MCIERNRISKSGGGMSKSLRVYIPTMLWCYFKKRISYLGQIDSLTVLESKSEHLYLLIHLQAHLICQGSGQLVRKLKLVARSKTYVGLWRIEFELL